MSVSSYALIKGGVVVNAVLWNGEGDLFPEYETYEIKEEDQVGPSFTAEKDKKGSWVFTAPVVEITPEEQAQKNLNIAQSEYNHASAQITALNQRIEDEDYSGELTEAAVAKSKAELTAYRKALRAYIAEASGRDVLPKGPVNKLIM
ncbi:hypothetical protein RM153_07670 [Pantoea agglomerans]|uniref:hypothetical protein n=1 Tax=Enterobacter agglomerans TaxID=549 RepID=UPI00289F4E35|nr:hypothetical protein [Pantoea agglomerans]WNK50201.1 hypothetical protein RM153_07670 [Pantoea agglomerans]